MVTLCCSLPLTLLIQALLLVFLITTVAGYSAENDLILLPHDPVVEDGQALILNCTIAEKYTGPYTNRDVHFRWGNVNYTNVTFVGSRTTLLQRRWNLSENGHIRCALPDRPHVLSAIQQVTVVRRPLQPNVTHCLLLNWKDVNCTWEPSLSRQQDHMHTDTPLIQTVQWKLAEEASDVWQNAACRGEVTNSCVWNISRVVSRFIEAEICCVQVLARISLNQLHFSTQSAQFCFRPVNNVVLSEPRNLATVADKATREINVQWEPPLLDPYHFHNVELIYAVTVLSQFSDIPVINVSVTNHSLSFTLVPHTHYTITVSVRTKESLFWSKPTYDIFTTEPAIPKMSPPSSPNAFTVTHVERYRRTVVIYWQTLPPQDRHGERLSYIVLMRKPPVLDWSELNVIPSAKQAWRDVVVDTQSAVELTVIARNEVGQTLPGVVMHLPATQSSGVTAAPFVKLVVELMNATVVVYSWQLQTLDRGSSLTLFWCRSSLSPGGHCADDIHWLDVSASETEHSLSIDTADTAHHSYGAASNPATGIDWVACLYNMTGLAGPVHDVKAVVPSYGNPGQLLVTWVHPSCDVRHGYIQSLVLMYCRYVDSQCAEEPRNISLPGHLTEYNLGGLEQGAEYGIWMYSWTRTGQSPTHSDIVIAETSASALTPGLIAGLVACGLVVVVLAVIIVWKLCKYCRRCWNKLSPPVIVTVPSERVRVDTSTSTSPPILEYSRISYERQGSRLSSSSHDSGQFGVPSGSPLMSPKSVVTPLIAEHQQQLPPSEADRGQPSGRTYVNDLRHPAENSHHHHHRPVSPTSSGRAEFIPLQPMRPHDTAADAEDNNIDEEMRVTDNQMNRRPNGGYDSVALSMNADYIPHNWLKM